MGLEGELRIGLQVRNARIERIGITSTRPDVARSLLQGRSRHEAVAAVAQLFSICAHAQAAASALACAAGAGEALLPQRLAESRASVCGEMVRELAWRSLLAAPQALGEPPADDALAAARASQAFHCHTALGPHTSDVAHTIARAAFGMNADAWLAQPSLAAFDHWADTAPTATARLMRRLRDEDAREGSDTRQRSATDPPLLAAQDHATWIGELGAACAADPDFAHLPVWRGAPAETGALARQCGVPLIDALLRRSATRVPARHAARLYEFALLLAGQATATLGAMTLAGGAGIAWVENARGLLVHLVRLEGERVSSYCILAPTEWNFHPGGALAAALLGAPATDLEALRRRCTQLVDSLDPCVACRVEFDDA